MTIKQHTLDTPYMVGPVHCYTAEINDELMLFDTGPPTSVAKQYIAENVDLKKLKYIFITHCHIDHYGLAHWLEQESDAQLFIPYRDGLKILSHEERLQDMYDLLQRLGFSGEFLEGLHKSLSNGVFPIFPEKFKIIEDDFPNHLGIRYLGCPGHSQSDIVFYSDEWAVTGDVLLKGVFQSPLLDVDQETGERFKNYESYCSTLIKLSSLRDKLICPGHRKKIDTVDQTILFYVSKMLGRTSQLKKFDSDENVAQITRKIFGDNTKETFLLYLKASEVLFMQDFLANPNLLKNSLQEIGLFEHVISQYEEAVSSTLFVSH